MMSKQLVNIMGSVVVAAVLVAGTLLIGWPLLSQSTNTGAEADRVDNANAGYANQVAALQKEKKDLTGLASSVASLRAQIPSTNRQDDVFELVSRAAATAGVVITSVTASDATAWTARSAATPIGTAGGGAGAGGSSSSASAPTPAPTPTPSASSAPAASPGPASTQTQIPFVIVVAAPSPRAAMHFIDDLRTGPRLLGIVHAEMSADDTRYDLTVDALAFVRAEK